MRMPAPALVLSATLAACSCGSGATTGLGSREHREVQPFTTWSEPGLSLFVACESVPDQSTCAVYGQDANGAVIEGPALLVRVAARPELGPEELARRAEGLLFGEAGAEPVLPGAAPGLFMSAEELSIVTAPAREGGALSYFRMDGEMHPTLQRVRVDLTTGTVLDRSSASSIYAETAPAIETVCEVWTSCGCTMGCGSFEHVATPEGERFRSADRRLYFRPPGGAPLRVVGEEICTETCLVSPTRTSCAFVEGVCGPAPVGVPAAAPAGS